MLQSMMASSLHDEVAESGGHLKITAHMPLLSQAVCCAALVIDLPAADALHDTRALQTHGRVQRGLLLLADCWRRSRWRTPSSPKLLASLQLCRSGILHEADDMLMKVLSHRPSSSIPCQDSNLQAHSMWRGLQVERMSFQRSAAF